MLVKDLRGSDGAKMSYVAQLVYLCFFTSRIAGLLCLPTVKVFHFSHPVHKALKRSIFLLSSLDRWPRLHPCRCFLGSIREEQVGGDVNGKKKISLSYVSVCKCVCVCDEFAVVHRLQV